MNVTLEIRKLENKQHALQVRLDNVRLAKRVGETVFFVGDKQVSYQECVAAIRAEMTATSDRLDTLYDQKYGA